VPGGKAAEIQTGGGEPRDLSHLSLREEPIGDAALVKDLDGARMQASCAGAREVLAGAPLDNGDVNPCQRQPARQHRPCGRTRGLPPDDPACEGKCAGHLNHWYDSEEHAPNTASALTQVVLCRFRPAPVVRQAAPCRRTISLIQIGANGDVQFGGVG
jgi:hypothetical protein